MRTLLHLVTIAALALVTLSTSACGQTAKSVTVEEAKAMIDKNATIVVYCAVGGRSSRAASMMVQKGYKNVINMAGGINAWNAAGYPTTK